MDLFILISAIFTFLFFLVIHIVVFKIIGGEKILKGLVYSIVLSSLFHLIWLSFNMPIFWFGISLFISLLLTVIYVWGFLGLVTTSLRIQLLVEIEKLGNKGIEHDRLLKLYNRNTILNNRLERLLGSGEIEKHGECYKLGLKLSYFKFHIMAIEILNRLYKKTKYKF